MDFKSVTHVFFIGIGGIGMSALARFFLAAGKIISGYDRTSTALTDELISEGISIMFNDDVGAIEDIFKSIPNRNSILIVYTPAIPPDSRILSWYRQNGFTLFKRSEILGFITRGQKTIAVAGTHGKTTTSTMIAHLLHHAGINCTAFLGGIAKNFDSNLILGDRTGSKGEHVMVVEADEYDRSFLQLYPDCAVITATAPDHLDIYKTYQAMLESYQQFASQVSEDGLILTKKEVNTGPVKTTVRRYGFNPPADYYCKVTNTQPDAYFFDIYTPDEKLEKVRLALPGSHNVENAVAAVAVAKWMKVDNSRIRSGLESFLGIKRRFEFVIRHPLLTFIDDYAHHPDEIESALNSVKEIFPGKRIAGVFQPHLFTRTRDFADRFAFSLNKLDRIFLLPIYPAREKPIEGVTSALILNKISGACSLETFESLPGKLLNESFDVLITLGAGDIDKLIRPIVKLLNQRLKNLASDEK